MIRMKYEILEAPKRGRTVSDDFAITFSITTSRTLGVLGDFTGDRGPGANAALKQMLEEWVPKYLESWRNLRTAGDIIVTATCKSINNWLNNHPARPQTTLVVFLADSKQKQLDYRCYGDSGLAIVTPEGLKFLHRGNQTGGKDASGHLPLLAELLQSKALSEPFAEPWSLLAYSDGLWDNFSTGQPESLRKLEQDLSDMLHLGSLADQLAGFKQLMSKNSGRDDLTILIGKGEEQMNPSQAEPKKSPSDQATSAAFDRLSREVVMLKARIEELQNRHPLPEADIYTFLAKIEEAYEKEIKNTAKELIRPLIEKEVKTSKKDLSDFSNKLLDESKNDFAKHTAKHQSLPSVASPQIQKLTTELEKFQSNIEERLLTLETLNNISIPTQPKTKDSNASKKSIINSFMEFALSHFAPIMATIATIATAIFIITYFYFIPPPPPIDKGKTPAKAGNSADAQPQAPSEIIKCNSAQTGLEPKTANLLSIVLNKKHSEILKEAEIATKELGFKALKDDKKHNYIMQKVLAINTDGNFGTNSKRKANFEISTCIDRLSLLQSSESEADKIVNIFNEFRKNPPTTNSQYIPFKFESKELELVLCRDNQPTQMAHLLTKAEDITTEDEAFKALALCLKYNLHSCDGNNVELVYVINQLINLNLADNDKNTKIQELVKSVFVDKTMYVPPAEPASQ